MVATSHHYRKHLEFATKAYSELCDRFAKKSFADSVLLAVDGAEDTPALRAWSHCILQLEGFRAGREPVPNPSAVGHLHADAPSVDQLIELLGWQAIGAACRLDRDHSFVLPSSPPVQFAVGSAGAFRVPDHWPASGEWSLEVREGMATLRGPDYEARSIQQDACWASNISLQGSNLNAVAPLHDTALMNRDFQEFPMVRSAAYTATWAPLVREASIAIGKYSSSAADCVRLLVRAIVPLVCGIDAVGSASREEALGLIFLPACEMHDQLSECLLHETMHQYLFRLEECGALFTEDATDDHTFYSPWRTDPRPLRMTLHGAFVFAAVADFYAWEGSGLELGLSASECVKRAYHRLKQVELAVDIVQRHANLTKFGEVVLGALQSDLTELFARGNPTPDDVSEVEILIRVSQRTACRVCMLIPSARTLALLFS